MNKHNMVSTQACDRGTVKACGQLMPAGEQAHTPLDRHPCIVGTVTEQMSHRRPQKQLPYFFY